ncbi:MFS transporter [Marinibacterium profundimaris]|uniref:Major facilitator transporter n=1 Tax=Marinibacterium profundimaris TaxID=1679460 RepID=A0A225NRC0_9RHOB|nr:MFS transporter [Marinibacterium profundimaris]OWU77491.1 major facilitator transporter [Marinibacterium profundimaris]
MIKVISSTWALMLGMMLLMLGNGIQSTLLGVRGEIEGFSTLQMSFVMSGYFLGFLGGSRLAPEMIRRVGHVRVFAALASLISAVMILYPYPVFTNPIAWTVGRCIVGFCFSGVYVTAESWLNNAATNETRGQSLSLYMIVQTLGIISAQGALLIGDPAGFEVFIVASVLVSVSFAPILLSVTPTPAYETSKPMTLRRLFESSPLGCIGIFLLGGVYSGLFGMSAVYGAAVGLTLGQISIFVASFYVGALFLQYPIGWMSDRMDRRMLIFIGGLIGGGAAILGMWAEEGFPILLGAAFVVGGMTNPLYSLLLSHTNDHLAHEDMASASGGLIFINGCGAIAGPLITGWLMSPAIFGPSGFFLFIGGLLLALSGYAAYRSTKRASVPLDEAGAYASVAPTLTSVAMEVAQEMVIEAGEDEDETEAAA